MRDITKAQLGSEVLEAAERYWQLKKDQGLPEEFEQAVKFAFIRGWQEREKSKNEE